MVGLAGAAHAGARARDGRTQPRLDRDAAGRPRARDRDPRRQRSQASSRPRERASRGEHRLRSRAQLRVARRSRSRAGVGGRSREAHDLEVAALDRRDPRADPCGDRLSLGKDQGRGRCARRRLERLRDGRAERSAAPDAGGPRVRDVVQSARPREGDPTPRTLASSGFSGTGGPRWPRSSRSTSSPRAVRPSSRGRAGLGLRSVWTSATQAAPADRARSSACARAAR